MWNRDSVPRLNVDIQHIGAPNIIVRASSLGESIDKRLIYFLAFLSFTRGVLQYGATAIEEADGFYSQAARFWGLISWDSRI